MINNTLYFDITATTAVISAVAGVVVAVGAVVIVWFRKAKKKVSDKLGIEERQTKEVEEAVVRIDKTSTEESNDK